MHARVSVGGYISRLPRWGLWLLAGAFLILLVAGFVFVRNSGFGRGDLFYVRSWVAGPNATSPSGKCLDYGVSPSRNGATVFLNDCSRAHRIRVVEINSSHDVVLYAGSHVIGAIMPTIKTAGGRPGPPSTEFPLELESVNRVRGPKPNQIFAYDGDSIILEGSRPCVNTDVTPSTNLCPPPPPQLVIKIQNARGANGSPLVVGVRDLADNEFWDFNAVDGSGRYPTSGFTTTAIATSYDLWNAICSSPKAFANAPPTTQCMPQNFKVGWNSVVVVTGSDPNECTADVGPCLDFSAYPPLALPAGVTLRGNRRGTNLGPQLFAAFSGEKETQGLCSWCMINIRGDYARVTGLRLRGQSRATDGIDPNARTDGIQVGIAGTYPPPPEVPSALATITEFIATIDHNDASDWENAAVNTAQTFIFFNSSAKGNRCGYDGYSNPKSDPPDTYGCDENFRFAPNVPYSLCSPQPCSQPGPVAIAEDPINPPGPGTLANIRVTRNFLHHNLRDDGGYGVQAGRALIDGNTFLWNRHDITANGEPHNEYRASHNLVLSSAYGHYGFLGLNGRLQDFDMHGTANAGSITFFVGGAGGYYVEIDGNTFLGAKNSIGGAGHDYVLRGYPIANSYYHDNRSLRTESDAVQFLHCVTLLGCTNTCGSLFACNNNSKDFPISVEGNGNQWADSHPPYTDPTFHLGVGDFDGDGKSDLLLTTGAAWYYSPGANAEWRFLSAKPDQLDSLLLGDFDGDGRTDVVGMNPSGQFDVSWGGISDFVVINTNPCSQGVPVDCPKSVHDMAVGDFDGDGISDIFYADGKHWYISFSGTAAFIPVNDSSFRVKDLRFGHFSICGNNKETDVFGIVGEPVGKWMVTCGARGDWVPLPVSLTDRLNGAVINGGVVIRDLVVADFDGDGNADVAGVTDPVVLTVGSGNTVTNVSVVGWSWAFSPNGAKDWKSHWHSITPGTQPPEPCGLSFSIDRLPMRSPVPAGQKTLGVASALLAAVGQFSGQKGSDILLWGDGTNFCLVQGGTGDAQRQSRQDMR